jgi:hypothetical protein
MSRPDFNKDLPPTFPFLPSTWYYWPAGPADTSRFLCLCKERGLEPVHNVKKQRYEASCIFPVWDEIMAILSYEEDTREQYDYESICESATWGEVTDNE